MASLIGGKTVNTWGVIPICPEAADRKRQATSKDGDVDDLFLNAFINTISPQLLSQLESAIRRACQRHPYARGDGRQRPFGGINIIFAGDLWQLGPVRAAALFSNPYEKGLSPGGQRSSRCSGSVMKTAFRKRSSSRRQAHDKSMNEGLPQGRSAGLRDLGNVLLHPWPAHGESWKLESRNGRSGMPRQELQIIGKGLGGAVSRGEKIKWPARVEFECVECRQERTRRCIILSTDADNQASFQQAPFTESPFVHPFRYPSGHAQQFLAIEFAKSHKQRVLWFVTYDKPNAKESLKLRGERGEQRKGEWLMLPNARTSGVPGLRHRYRTYQFASQTPQTKQRGRKESSSTLEGGYAAGFLTKLNSNDCARTLTTRKSCSRSDHGNSSSNQSPRTKTYPSSTASAYTL